MKPRDTPSEDPSNIDALIDAILSGRSVPGEEITQDQIERAADPAFWQGYAARRDREGQTAEETDALAIIYREAFELLRADPTLLGEADWPGPEEIEIEWPERNALPNEMRRPGESTLIDDVLHVLFPAVRARQSWSPNLFYFLHPTERDTPDGTRFKDHVASYKMTGFALIEERVAKTRELRRLHVVVVPYGIAVPESAADLKAGAWFAPLAVTHRPYSEATMTPRPDQPYIPMPESKVREGAEDWAPMLQTVSDSLTYELAQQRPVDDLSVYRVLSTQIFLARDTTPGDFENVVGDVMVWVVKEGIKTALRGAKAAGPVASAVTALSSAIIDKIRSGLASLSKPEDAFLSIDLEGWDGAKAIPINRDGTPPAKLRSLPMRGTKVGVVARNQPRDADYRPFPDRTIRLKTMDYVRTRFEFEGRIRLMVTRK